MDVEPKRENAYGLAPTAACPRVASVARRTVLGWSKRSTGKSPTGQKENVSQGTVMTLVPPFLFLFCKSLIVLFSADPAKQARNSVHLVRSVFESFK